MIKNRTVWAFFCLLSITVHGSEIEDIWGDCEELPSAGTPSSLLEEALLIARETSNHSSPSPQNSPNNTTPIPSRSPSLESLAEQGKPSSHQRSQSLTSMRDTQQSPPTPTRSASLLSMQIYSKEHKPNSESEVFESPRSSKSSPPEKTSRSVSLVSLQETEPLQVCGSCGQDPNISTAGSPRSPSPIHRTESRGSMQVGEILELAGMRALRERASPTFSACKKNTKRPTPFNSRTPSPIPSDLENEELVQARNNLIKAQLQALQKEAILAQKRQALAELRTKNTEILYQLESEKNRRLRHLLQAINDGNAPLLPIGLP